jgi:hypothetical protein
MNNNKLLSALCYFSILFSPLLIPFIVYLVTDDKEVKGHAKRSLVSHLVPVVILIVGFIIFSFSIFSFENRMMDMMTGRFNFWNLAPFIFMAIYALLFAVIFVWNLIQGVKALR